MARGTVRSPEEKGYMMAAGSAALLSTTALLAKFLLASGAEPVVMAGYRAGVAGILLGAYLVIRQPALVRVARRSLGPLALFGFVLALGNLLYFLALQWTPAAVAVILLYTYPVYVVLYERFVEGKPLTKAKAVALLLAFIGCVLITEAYQASLLRLNLTGILAGVGCGLAVAAYSLLGKRMVATYHPLTLNVYSFVFGSLILVLASPPAGFFAARFNVTEWGLILGLALGPMILGYWLLVGALRYLDASKVGIVGMLEPVLVAIWGWVFLSESLTIFQISGAVIAIMGVGGLRLLGGSASKETSKASG